MEELELYKFQLEQVTKSLLLSPTNEDLIKLRNDLAEAIELTEELLLPPKVEKEPSIKKKKAEIDNRQNENPEIIENTIWKIGDKCQVKNIETGAWLDGTVSGLSANRQLFTVRMSDSHKIKTVQSEFVRKLFSSEQYIKQQQQQNISHEKPTQRALEPRDIEHQRKRVKSRKEYIARKDQEHADKANSWKSFKDGLCKKSTPSLFKSRLHRDT